MGSVPQSMNWIEIHGIVHECSTRELGDKYFLVNLAMTFINSKKIKQQINQFTEQFKAHFH